MAGLGGRRGRAAGRTALPVVAALLLAGCASMPSSGEVRKVDDGQTAGTDAQVQVFGIPPQPGETPSEIVSGFLEAITSGEPDFATAKKYLASSQQHHWDPFAGITVLADRRNHVDADIEPEATEATVAVNGHKAAMVDAKHAYEPARGTFQVQLHLVKQRNEWRIDRLPDGLVLSESDFKRIYHSVNLYYFADLGADGHRTDGAPAATLVADPVYLRQQQPDALASTVTALLDGPTKWLAPAVSSAVPPGVGLYSKKQGQSVALDDSQRLKVRLDKAADSLSGQRCARLAAQLFATVQGQASVRLTGVEVLRADGVSACEQSSAQAQSYGPGNLVGANGERYFIGPEHELYELPADGGTRAAPVLGAFGTPKADLGSVAVRRDKRVAAGVTQDGKQLLVGSLDGAEERGKPLASAAKDPKNGLSAPSWDGFGDLWVADRNPAVSKLYVLPDGTGQPAEVSVPQLSGRIESLRVASDGIRIALVVDKNGVPTLQLGLIKRGGTATQPKFTVEGLRDLTAGQSVSSVSWAGPSRLVVLGGDAGGGQQIEYVNTDGSAVPAQLGSIGEAVSIAASEDPTRPLLASYGGSVYWLPTDSNWKKVTPKGSSPVYPG